MSRARAGETGLAASRELAIGPSAASNDVRYCTVVRTEADIGSVGAKRSD
jgi:hypothetical protein